MLSVQPKVYKQVTKEQKKKQLTKLDIRHLQQLRSKLNKKFQDQSKLIRLAYVLTLSSSNNEGSPSLAAALHAVLKSGDLYSSSSVTPVGKLKLLIAEYYFDGNYKFTGEDDDLAGKFDFKSAHDWDKKFNVPAYTWTKADLHIEGDSIVSGSEEESKFRVLMTEAGCCCIEVVKEKTLNPFLVEVST
jgi:hypothetical protein